MKPTHRQTSKRAMAGGTTLLVSMCLSAASAQEVLAPGLEFELGAGVLTAPTYEGSKDYKVSPFPLFNFGYLATRNGFTLGGGDGQGLSARPSFRYLGPREASDHSELTGLKDTDAALELGAGVAYTMGAASAFTDIRYGVTGHNGFVGEFGADYVMRPEANTTITVGPRVSWASGNYMEEYFSVSAAESGASGLNQFDADAGFKSIGLEASVRHDFNENWAVETGAGYNRLVGDAADSPITDMGSKDQFSGKIGIVRKFRFDF